MTATDTDQQHASILLQTMYESKSPRGRSFRAEFDELFERYERLIRFLNHWSLPRRTNGMPGELRELDKWIGELARPWRHFYPRARPLSPAQQAEYDRREALRQTWTDDLTRTWPDKPGRTEMDDDYITVLDALCDWTFEVHQKANPQRRRMSRRVVANRYIDAVREFVQRWGLRAWWAVPAVVHSHSLRASVGADTPMMIYGLGARMVQTCTFMVRLPDRSDEEFEHDSRFFRELHLEAGHTFEDGLRSSIRRRPDRHELDEIERREDASTVTLHWVPARQQAPVAEILRACGLRLGRPLTRLEDRDIRGQLDPQVRAAKRELASSSEWEPLSNADTGTHARWTATRLLEPKLTWDQIAARDAIENLGSPHPDAVRHAVTRFAARAKLELLR